MQFSHVHGSKIRYIALTNGKVGYHINIYGIFLGRAYTESVIFAPITTVHIAIPYPVIAAVYAEFKMLL